MKTCRSSFPCVAAVAGLLFIADPVSAQGVTNKIQFLSNHGGSYMEAGEVQVMGKLLPQAAPAPTYTNVAAASGGARIEKYTSQGRDQ